MADLVHLSAWQEPTGLSWSDHRDYDAAVEEAGEAAIDGLFHRYRGTIVIDTSGGLIRHVADVDLTAAALEYQREHDENCAHSVHHQQSWRAYA